MFILPNFSLATNFLPQISVVFYSDNTHSLEGYRAYIKLSNARSTTLCYSSRRFEQFPKEIAKTSLNRNALQMVYILVSKLYVFLLLRTIKNSVFSL